jgi:hypothetical protein
MQLTRGVCHRSDGFVKVSYVILFNLLFCSALPVVLNGLLCMLERDLFCNQGYRALLDNCVRSGGDHLLILRLLSTMVAHVQVPIVSLSRCSSSHLVSRVCFEASLLFLRAFLSIHGLFLKTY